jgi:hypothetical protein
VKALPNAVKPGKKGLISNDIKPNETRTTNHESLFLERRDRDNALKARHRSEPGGSPKCSTNSSAL